MGAEKRNAAGDIVKRPEYVPPQRSSAENNLLQHRPFIDGYGNSDVYYRNLYVREVDFRQLARRDADFAVVLKNTGQLDFSDPRAVMQLTKTLVKLDFGLKLNLPDDRLCPPVPNRHNYILWLKDLMDSTSYNDSSTKVLALDIGTGASCIYPLLGTVQRPWNFIATDVDGKNVEYARRNVQLNDLEDRIRIIARKPPDPLIPLDELDIDSIDFTMTNPPFYTSEDEMISSAQKKARPPHSACTGAEVEMVCDGGELGFVGRLFEESLILRERVRWYTSMFGKLSSVEAFVEKLRKHGIDNYAVTELIQGTKTRRWVVGWSFGAMRPTQNVARGLKSSVLKPLLPDMVEVDLCSIPLDQGPESLATKITNTIGSLALLSWEWDLVNLRGTGRARENVWSRAWRRKMLREKSHGPEMRWDEGGIPQQTETCAFGFMIAINIGKTESTARLRWIEGHDKILFESFAGYLKDRLQGRK